MTIKKRIISILLILMICFSFIFGFPINSYAIDTKYNDDVYVMALLLLSMGYGTATITNENKEPDLERISENILYASQIVLDNLRNAGSEFPSVLLSSINHSKRTVDNVLVDLDTYNSIVSAVPKNYQYFGLSLRNLTLNDYTFSYGSHSNLSDFRFSESFNAKEFVPATSSFIFDTAWIGQSSKVYEWIEDNSNNGLYRLYENGVIKSIGGSEATYFFSSRPYFYVLHSVTWNSYRGYIHKSQLFTSDFDGVPYELTAGLEISSVGLVTELFFHKKLATKIPAPVEGQVYNMSFNIPTKIALANYIVNTNFSQIPDDVVYDEDGNIIIGGGLDNGLDPGSNNPGDSNDSFWELFLNEFRVDWDIVRDDFVNRLSNTVSKIPLVGQVVTVWNYIYDGDLTGDSSVFLDSETQSRLNALGDLNLTKYNEVFANPGELTLKVPTPFKSEWRCSPLHYTPNEDGEIVTCHYDNTTDFKVPLHIYTDNIVDLHFLGLKIRSIRDVVFFFLNITLWWNFVKRFTRFAVGLFSSDPLGDFIPETSTSYSATLDENNNVTSVRESTITRDRLHNVTEQKTKEYYTSFHKYKNKGGDKK